MIIDCIVQRSIHFRFFIKPRAPYIFAQCAHLYSALGISRVKLLTIYHMSGQIVRSVWAKISILIRRSICLGIWPFQLQQWWFEPSRKAKIWARSRGISTTSWQRSGSNL